MSSTVSQNALLAEAELWRFLAELSKPEPVPLADEQAPPWFEAGVVSEISQEIYFDFLELFAPRWIRGSVFVFGEGSGPMRLLWRRDGGCFGRELTAEEAERFCRLSGTTSSK